jgi:nicotinamide-nucleotide amidase
MTLKSQILDLSRQNNIGALSPFIDKLFDEQIERGLFPTTSDLAATKDAIIKFLEDYREQTGRQTVVLGMSGGVDSALTAALFKSAGWRVIGVTMPIHQNPEETARGKEACEALGIEARHIDLSDLYDVTLKHEAVLDPELNGPIMETFGNELRVAIRKGNIRARLRMVTLYNLAAKEGGIVASTDNFSELGAGFWTLHGDVGDVSPIQALLKSWEVPYISSIAGVPESTYRATPTDGLGISNGDEAQLGASYLEWDIMVNAMMTLDLHSLKKFIEASQDERAMVVFSAVSQRLGSSWFKRMNPVNTKHPLFPDRYEQLAGLDQEFQPKVVL